jgi:hypothetical protein
MPGPRPRTVGEEPAWPGGELAGGPGADTVAPCTDPVAL